MKKIGLSVLVVFVLFILWMNLTPGHFQLDCNGGISYLEKDHSCQLLPKPISQNVINSFLLAFSNIDIYK